MTYSSRSVQRSMVWVWRLRTRTASRRISQVGHWCASWKTGVRRSLVSSSTIQVNGSYDRHSRRLSILCASAREKQRPPDDLSGGRLVVSFVVILLRFPVDLRSPSHNTDGPEHRLWRASPGR